jgi:hypothetical protein
VSEKKSAVEATLDDLPSVDTAPILKPVAATITLDEEPAVAPSATQLLDPVEEVQTDPRVRVPPGQLIGESAAATQPRRRAPLKADAFESFPSLGAPKKEETSPRGAPAPWKKAQVWTPELIVLTVIGALIVLAIVIFFLRS